MRLPNFLPILFLIGSHMSIVDGLHFLGGTITYRPLNQSATGSPVAILVTQTYSWTYQYVRCDANMISNSITVPPRGSLATDVLQCVYNCVSGTGGYTNINVIPYCTDFSIPLIATGSKRSDIVYLTEGADFAVAFASGDWRPLATAPAAKWSISTHFKINRRPDNGLYNSAPVATVISPQFIPYNKTYVVHIPIADADGDTMRCRWANKTNGIDECGDVCPPSSLPPNTVLYPNCTVIFVGLNISDWYAIAVVVEDFSSPTSTTPLSSVPIQFLAQVVNASSCPTPPEIVGSLPQLSCTPVVVGQTFSSELIANNYCGSNVTILDIATISFVGFNSDNLTQINSTTYYKRFSWTPSSLQLGYQTMCAVAVDSENTQSTQYCVTFYVSTTSGASCPGFPSIPRVDTTTQPPQNERNYWPIVGTAIGLLLLGLGLCSCLCYYYLCLAGRRYICDDDARPILYHIERCQSSKCYQYDVKSLSSFSLASFKSSSAFPYAKNAQTISNKRQKTTSSSPISTVSSGTYLYRNPNLYKLHGNREILLSRKRMIRRRFCERLFACLFRTQRPNGRRYFSDVKSDSSMKVSPTDTIEDQLNIHRLNRVQKAPHSKTKAYAKKRLNHERNKRPNKSTIIQPSSSHMHHQPSIPISPLSNFDDSSIINHYSKFKQPTKSSNKQIIYVKTKATPTKPANSSHDQNNEILSKQQQNKAAPDSSKINVIYLKAVDTPTELPNHSTVQLNHIVSNVSKVKHASDVSKTDIVYVKENGEPASQTNYYHVRKDENSPDSSKVNVVYLKAMDASTKSTDEFIVSQKKTVGYEFETNQPLETWRTDVIHENGSEASTQPSSQHYIQENQTLSKSKQTKEASNSSKVNVIYLRAIDTPTVSTNQSSIQMNEITSKTSDRNTVYAQENDVPAEQTGYYYVQENKISSKVKRSKATSEASTTDVVYSKITDGVSRASEEGAESSKANVIYLRAVDTFDDSVKYSHVGQSDSLSSETKVKQESGTSKVNIIYLKADDGSNQSADHSTILQKITSPSALADTNGSMHAVSKRINRSEKDESSDVRSTKKKPDIKNTKDKDVVKNRVRVTRVQRSILPD